MLNVDRGIFINYSPFTTVSDNRIEYSYCYGVKFFYSHDSVVTNNILVDSGIRIEESVLIDYVSYTFSNNTLNTKPIGYFVNQDGLVINTNFYSQLFLINCTNTSISSQNFTNYYLGIFAFYCSSLTIESNNFNGNNKGIHILSSNSIIIQDNSFSNNKKAILVSSSSIVYIANNIIGDSTGWCPTLEVIFSSSVSIFYNTLINVHRGIKLYMSSASVSNNSVSNSHCFGIHFTDSTAINFTSNNLVESGVYIEEYTISEYSNYQVANNYINDKLLGWFIHEAGLTLDSSLYNQIILVNCSNSVISNQELMNSYIGIYAIFCTSLTITNNYFNKCNRGIVVIESENVFVSYNFLDEISRGMYFRNIHNSTIIDNTLLSIKCIAIYCQFSSNITFAYNYIDNYNNWADVGLNIEESHSVVVKQNIITNYFWRAIDVQHSTYLTISENVLTQNELGIYFWFSSNSSIMNNIIKDNYEFGVSLQSGSTYNTIYHNIFSNNRIDSGFIGSQGLDSGSNNDWYNTTLLEGNQWSDWSGSAAYTIEGSANSNDFYPMDLEGPQITDILITPAIPYPLQDIIVTATVIDNFALDMVSIFYSINNGSWVLGSMTANDDSYSFAFGSFNAYDFIQFYIVANDTSGNSVQTEIHSFTISPDTDAPTITSIYHSPSTPLINQEITISATVTDNVEVSIVYLYYRVNTGDWIQVEMTKSSSSSVYTASIGAFDGSVEIFYYIYAVDSSDNVTESNTIDFVVVLDEESPVITNVSHSPNTPKKDDNIVVRASVSDNIALHQVILYYRIDEGSWATIIMIFSTTNYKATINEPFEAGALIEYYVYAIDTSGNDAQSTIYSVNISDDTVPDDDDNDDNDDTELTVPLSFGSLAFFVLSLAVCATVNFIVFRRK